MKKPIALFALYVLMATTVIGCGDKKTLEDGTESQVETTSIEESTVAETTTSEVTTREEQTSNETTSEETASEETTRDKTASKDTTSENTTSKDTTVKPTQPQTPVQQAQPQPTQPQTPSSSGYKGISGKTAGEFGLYRFDENDLKTADKIVNSLGISNGSRYSKAKAVIDWLCINCHQFDESKNSWDTNSAQSIFRNRIGLCNGYSEAFYVMMTELGVPCKKITGTIGTYAHAWITVMMDDGKWYYLDANNIDANINGKYGNDPTGANINYNLFLMPYSKMGNYHPDVAMPTPYGTSFEYQNRALTERTQAEIDKLKQKYANSGYMVIALGGKETIAADIKKAMQTLQNRKKYVFISTVSTKGIDINWYAAAKKLYAEMKPDPNYSIFFAMTNKLEYSTEEASALAFTYVAKAKQVGSMSSYIYVDENGRVYDTNSYVSQEY